MGDHDRAVWHPSREVQGQVFRSLDGLDELAAQENYEDMGLAQLARYSLIVMYVDKWPELCLAHPQMEAALIAYVEGGGALLTLHYPSIAQREGARYLVGARFDYHPPKRMLNYAPHNPPHPVLVGINAFEVEDEAYHFVFDDKSPRRDLLMLNAGGQTIPAAWAMQIGMGKTGYIAPGHTAATYSHPEMQKLVRNMASWLRR